MMNRIFCNSVLFLISMCGLNAFAQVSLSFEAKGIWQTRNEFRIPGTTGTLVDVSDFEKGPFWGYRVYAGYKWNSKHEIRALYAPLKITSTVSFDNPVSFMDETFAASTETEALYMFNSYRLGYTYFFKNTGSWNWGLGFTGKIRDAEIRLTQGALTASKTNVGFVPLLRLVGSTMMGDSTKLELDIEGLGAPQGRAIDASVQLKQLLGFFGAGHSLWGFVGYRTVEGGADNDEVFNFAWLHFASVGFYAEF